MALEGLQSVLGQGVYGLADVSSYTGLHPARLRSWFVNRDDRRQSPIFRPGHGDVGMLNFLDLMDVRVVGQMRAAGVSFPTIRAAQRALRERLGTDHPFSHHALYTDGRRIFIDISAQIGDSWLTEVVSGQGFFPRVKDSLTSVEYSTGSRLASRWNIAEGVVIDPRLAFGRPVIKDTGVTTYVLAAAFRANGGDTALTAGLFDVREEEVSSAVRFEASTRLRRAA